MRRDSGLRKYIYDTVCVSLFAQHTPEVQPIIPGCDPWPPIPGLPGGALTVQDVGAIHQSVSILVLGLTDKLSQDKVAEF